MWCWLFVISSMVFLVAAHEVKQNSAIGVGAYLG